MIKDSRKMINDSIEED